MRIASLYHDLVLRGGGQRLALAQAQLLQRKGHKVTLFVSQYSGMVYPGLAEALDFRVRQRTELSPLVRIPILRRTLSQLTEGVGWFPEELSDYDLVVAYTFPSNIGAYRAHRKLGLPAIWHCTHPSYWLYPRSSDERGASVTSSIIQDFARRPLRLLDREAVKAFSEVLVISSKIRQRVSMLYRRSSTLLFPVVDPKDFSTADDVREKNSILFVGRAAWGKGPDLFLNVLCRIAKVISQVKAVMVMFEDQFSKSFLEGISRMAIDLNLRDRLEIVSKPRADFDISKYYARASVIAYTCRDEDFGLVPLEASIAGTPSVVWSDCGCAMDGILENERSALVVPRYDLDRFSGCVIQLLQDDHLSSKLSAEARNSTLLNCSPEVHGRNLEAAILRVAGKR